MLLFIISSLFILISIYISIEVILPLVSKLSIENKISTKSNSLIGNKRETVVKETFITEEPDPERVFLLEFLEKNYSINELNLQFEPFTDTFSVSTDINTRQLKIEFIRIICAYCNTYKRSPEYDFLNDFPSYQKIPACLNLTYLLSRDNIILLDLLKELNILCLDVIESTTLDNNTKDYVESILLEHVYYSLKAMYSYNLHMTSQTRYSSTIFKDEFYNKLYFKTKTYVEELKKLSIKSTDLFIKQQFSFIESNSTYKLNKVESLTDNILLKIKDDTFNLEIKVIVTKMKNELLPKIKKWLENKNTSTEDLKTIDIVLDKIINLLESYNSEVYSKEENLTSEIAVIDRYLGYLKG